MMDGMDVGKDNFDKLDKRVEKLEKETAKYMEGDLSDLAEGLKDDIDSVKGQIDKAKKDSKARLFKNIITAGVAALFLGGVAFVFGPRKAGAAPLTAYTTSPEVTFGPTQLAPYVQAETFRGAMEGYVFKLGDQGLGYYLDTGAVAPAPEESGPFLMVRNNPAIAVAVGVAGVSIPLALRFRPSRRSAPDFSPWKAATAAASAAAPPPTSPSPPPASAAPPPSPAASSSSVGSAPPPPSAASPEAAASAAPETPPSVAVGVQDPATMKARELKAAILELGGNPTGLVEKSELVALLRKLQAEPRVMPTQPYKSNSDSATSAAGGPDIDADFANMDPSKMDPAAMQDMMGNPMIEKLSKQMMNDPETMREVQEAMSSGKGMGGLMNNASFKKMTENLMQDPEIIKMMQNPAEVSKMMDQMKKMGVNPPNM